MSELNPQLQGQIGYDRPVQQAPSVLGSVANVAGGLLDQYSRSSQRAAPSASDQKNAALSPFAARMDEIYSMPISQNEKDRLYNSVYREHLVSNPAYESDIRDIASNYGYTSAMEDTTLQAERAYNEWTQSPVGQAAVATLAVGNGNGGVDDDATRQRVEQYYLEQQTELVLATNLANSQAGDERKWRQLSVNWAQQSGDFAEGLVVQASQSPEFLQNPEEVMQLLNSTIIARQASVRESATLAGIAPQYIEEHIASVIKPITDLRETYNNMADDTTRMMRALETAQQHGVVQQFVEMNPVFADEAARNVFLQYFIAGNFTEETAAQFFDTTKNLSDAGRLSGDTAFNLSLSTVPSNAEIVNDTSPLQPEAVSELRTQLQQNPEQATQEMNMYLASLQGADVSTDAGKAQFENAVVNTTLLSEALDRPIGYETLNQLLSRDVMQRASSFEEGSSVQQNLLSLISRQITQHRRALSGRPNLVLAVEGGKFVALRRATPTDRRLGNVRPDGMVVARMSDGVEAREGQGRNPDVAAVPSQFEDKNIRSLNLLWESAKGNPLMRDAILNQLNLTNAGHTTDPQLQELQNSASQGSSIQMSSRGLRDGIVETGTPIGIANYERVSNDTPFVQGVGQMSSRLGADPVHIMQAISFETAGTFDAGIRNPGSSATGLIQFIESTARGLGTSTERLAQMDRTEQLKYVEKYLQPFSGRLNNLGDVYMAIHWPAGVGKEDTFVMYRQGGPEYDVNTNLDLNNDGVITRGEAVARVMEHNGRAPGTFPDMRNAGQDGVFASDGQPMDIVRPEARQNEVTVSTRSAPAPTPTPTPAPAQAQSLAPQQSQRPQARDPAAASRNLTAQQRNQVYTRLRQGEDIQEILAEIRGEGEADG